MSAISLKSITGITSITTPAGVDNQLTLHTNNTTERVKIDVAGNVHVNNHLSIAGVTTVANDTQLIIGSNADNRIPFKIKQNTSASNHNQIDSRFTYFYSHAIRFWDQDNTSQAVAYFWNNQIGLYAQGSEKLRITGSAVEILNGNLTVDRDLDIDGHTNLDNVSVAGVTTFTGNPTIYNADPQLTFRDSNHSPFYYYLKGRGGAFVIEDSVNGDRLSFNANSSISVTASMFQISGASNVIGNLSTGGTLTLPDSIIHTGDTDTKIRFPANDTVTVETAGSERLRIASDGQNTIYSGAHDKGLDILPVGNSQETRLRIQAKNSSGTEHTFSFNAKQSANRLDISGTGPICFIGSQNVGVQNGTPTSPLHVGGSVNNSGVKATLFVGAATGDGMFHLRGDSPTVFFDKSGSGYAKILTDSSDLSVSNGVLGSEGTELVRITSGGQLLVGGFSSANQNNKIHARLADGGIANNSTASVILAENSGNAWITIGSGASSYGGILFADSGSSDIGQVRYNHSTNALEFLTNGGNSSNIRLRIDSSGYLIAKADIRLRRTASDNGALYFGDTNNNYIFGSDADDVITFATAGNERLRITSGGQILLGGTTSPNTFNGVGGVSNLVVAGSTADTDITDNSGASLTISNTDGTANNTAGLHFAREDTDGAPHYSGASVVAQFKETMNTGHYPKADLAFLTSTANNNAPSEKMRITAAGQLCIGGTDTVGTLVHIQNTSGDAYIRCRGEINKALLFNHGNNTAMGFIGSGGTNGGGGNDIAVQSNLGNVVIHTANGGVRKPNNPCFQAVRTSGGTISSGDYVTYNAVDVNIGSHYNNSNGVFTAPVAGIYLFHIASIAHNNASTVFRFYLRINNGNIGSGNDAHLRLDMNNDDNDYAPNASFTYYRYMNVNDTARVYFSSDGGNAAYSGSDYLKFAGHLVG